MSLFARDWRIKLSENFFNNFPWLIKICRSSIVFLVLYIFYFTSTNNYFPLSGAALSNPGFLFSEHAHMFFILTQPRFIRGVVLPWVISFLKKNLIMPLRKFYLKIYVGICRSEPQPRDSWGGSTPLLQLPDHMVYLPSFRTGSRSPPCLYPHLPRRGGVPRGHL